MELATFLRLLWDRKFILLMIAMFPALAVGLLNWFGIRTYASQLSYAMELTATDFQRMSSRFYGGGNQRILLAEMEAQGIVAVANKLKQAESEDDMRKVVDVHVTPNYVDFNNRRNMKLSLDRSWADNVEKIEQLRARILQLYIEAGGEAEAQKVVACIRRNFEEQLPLHELYDALVGRRYSLNNQLVYLEQGRVDNEEQLARIEATHRQLTLMAGTATENKSRSLSLELTDLKAEQEFLPISVQLEVYASRVALMRERIKSDQRMFALKLREANLLAEVSDQLEKAIENGHDLKAYLAFLQQASVGREQQEVELFNGLHRMADNYRLTRRALVTMPKVVPQARNTVRHAFMTAVICGMLGLFGVMVQANLARAKSA